VSAGERVSKCGRVELFAALACRWSGDGLIVVAMPLRCLVLTNDRGCRDTLRLAATLRGWPQREERLDRRSPDGDPLSAAVDYDLIFVDLRHLVGEARRRAWKTVACTGGRTAKLVVVCGAPEDPLEEQWVWELGASLYLPDTPVSAAVDCVCRHLASCWPGQTLATPRHPAEDAGTHRESSPP